MKLILSFLICSILFSCGISQHLPVPAYGWHKLDGNPIQSPYVGQVSWYVDYSHGIRLIYETIYVDGKPINYKAILKDPLLRGILCDENVCDFDGYR